MTSPEWRTGRSMRHSSHRTSGSGMRRSYVRTDGPSPESQFNPAMKAYTHAMKDRGAAEEYVVTCLATRPSAQRQGHGAALMRFVMEKAAKDGRNVRLSSQEASSVSWPSSRSLTRQRSWYESLGFRQIHRSTFPSPQGDMIERWVGVWSPPASR